MKGRKQFLGRKQFYFSAYYTTKERDNKYPTEIRDQMSNARFSPYNDTDIICNVKVYPGINSRSLGQE